MIAKVSRWAKWWLGVLIAIVTTDIIASWPKHHKPRSASEYLGHLFPRGWKRAVLIAIMAVLAIHIATQPQMKPLDNRVLPPPAFEACSDLNPPEHILHPRRPSVSPESQPAVNVR